MKKDPVILWIVAMALFAIGVSLGAASSQASDLSNQLQSGCYAYTIRPGDRVNSVRLLGVSGNVMSFMVDLSVDPSHLSGTDGIARPGPLQSVNVSVEPYDRNGNRLWSSFGPGHAALSGSSQVTTNSTLINANSLSQVYQLLVSFWEVGHLNGVHYCTMVDYSSIAKPVAPAVQQMVAQGSGYARKVFPPVVSIEACMSLTFNSSGTPKCEGRGGGKNGFWNYAPMILVHFRGLTPGNHKLYKDFIGKTREGKIKVFSKQIQPFRNNTKNSMVWFKSSVTVGKECAPCSVGLMLDARSNGVGEIEFSGSFE